MSNIAGSSNMNGAGIGGMQPLPEQPSADDKGWNPDDDQDFDRENNLQANLFDEGRTAADRAFENYNNELPNAP